MNQIDHNRVSIEPSLTRAQALSGFCSKILANDGRLTAMIVGICLGCLVTAAIAVLTHQNGTPQMATENLTVQTEGRAVANELSLPASCGATTAAGPTILSNQTTVTEGPTVEWSTSATQSGYPIYTSGAPRAIDWQGGDPLPLAQIPGRNGLVGNPPVDPPSSFGRAYSSSYPVAPQ